MFEQRARGVVAVLAAALLVGLTGCANTTPTQQRAATDSMAGAAASGAIPGAIAGDAGLGAGIGAGAGLLGGLAVDQRH